jgi:predicted nucleotidyltransferase
VIYEELASILRKTSGVADVLANRLAPVCDQIDIAVVFGSVASGKATQSSDIDLLLVGDLGFSEAVQLLYPAQDILGREINPKLYTAQEWAAAKKEGSAFIRELLTKPVIHVIGHNVIGGKDDPG